MEALNEYRLGDMLLRYVLDDRQHVGMMLVPWDMRERVLDKRWAVENLVQLHARGDQLPNGYANGHSMALSKASDRMTLVGQEEKDGRIITTLSDGAGRVARHQVTWHEGLQAMRVSVTFENQSEKPIVLDLLSSVNIGWMTPFEDGETCGTMRLHRVRSTWSAEGRLQSEPIEAVQLERSWTGHAIRVEKFGQVGSMPVRGWFPFAAVEDVKAGVTWAMQLACPSSWQMELRRKDDGLSMMAGLPDEDYGHWCKTIRPGERFETPEAYLTVGVGGVDETSQRLLTIQRENWLRRDAPLPMMFNEYCTTWGEPSHENMARIAAKLKGHGIDYLVMDAGWYGEGQDWSSCGGDWIPNKQMFPEGLKATADAIRAAGIKPGIWFEPETCAMDADIFRQEERLLKRHGTVIDTDNRRFLDMRKEENHAYLAERVIGLLKACGFDYIKVDYNDCIGVGCDDPDSLGEGLRQNMQGTLRFFRSMREALPNLYIENCASGGHRLEPSLMAATDMASFSDAHERPEIPIIAARLHRVILPGQSQIWAVLRATDSLRRLNYSLVSALLGVMCLSGDIMKLSPEQWAKVDEGIAFYKAVRDIIRDGVSALYGETSDSWRHPEGWQAVCRTTEKGETLVVAHTFGDAFPGEITLPVDARHVLRVMCSENNRVQLKDGKLTISFSAPFEAVAVHLDNRMEEKDA